MRATRRFRVRLGTALALAGLAATAAVGGAAPASAGLLGNLTCPLLGTLSQVTSAGWDSGATTSPSTLAQVESAIGASSLYSKGINGAGIGVALIDSGVVPVQGLTGTGKVVNGPDLSFESQQSSTAYLDSFGHGTHMAGIIAGDDGATGTFEGVAPGAHLVSVRVASHDGATDVSQVVAAIDWVVQHRNDPGLNIRVLNLSYGTESLQAYQVDPLAFAVENAWKHGIVTVVAGGTTAPPTGHCATRPSIPTCCRSGRPTSTSQASCSARPSPPSPVAARPARSTSSHRGSRSSRCATRAPPST